MTDRQLLATARLLHQRTANSPGQRRAGWVIYALMASLTGLVGLMLGRGPGLALGVGLPLALALTRDLRMRVAHARAARALKADEVREVERLNQHSDLEFTVRTARAITVHRVSLRDEVVIVGAGYSEWFPRQDFEIEPPGPDKRTRVRIGEAWKVAFIEPRDYAAYAAWSKKVSCLEPV